MRRETGDTFSEATNYSRKCTTSLAKISHKRICPCVKDVSLTVCCTRAMKWYRMTSYSNDFSDKDFQREYKKMKEIYKALLDKEPESDAVQQI